MKLNILERGEPIFTTAEAKAWCRVDLDDDDDLIDGLILAATEYAEVFLSRTIMPTTWSMSLDRFPCGTIEINVPPVNSITSVTYLPPDGGEPVEIEDFVLSAGEPALIYPGTCWPATRCVPNAVTIEFEAGYTSDTCPASIKTAIKMLVCGWYENRASIDATSLRPVPLAVESLLLSQRWGNY